MGELGEKVGGAGKGQIDPDRAGSSGDMRRAMVEGSFLQDSGAGKVKGTPGEGGQVLSYGKTHLEPRWEFGGWIGREERGHRGTFHLGFMVCYAELLCCVDPAMGPRRGLCHWGWSCLCLLGLGEGTRVTLGIWQDKGAAKS